MRSLEYWYCDNRISHIINRTQYLLQHINAPLLKNSTRRMRKTTVINWLHFRKQKKITILSKQRHECHAKLTKMSILIWLNRFFKLERIFWCCDRQKERIACNFRIFWRLNHILSIFGILFFVILTYRYDRTVREVLDIEWHSVSSSSLSSMIDNESGKTLGCFDLSSANDRAWIISIIRHLQRMRE